MFEIRGPGFPLMSSNKNEMLLPLNHLNIYEVTADSTIVQSNFAEKETEEKISI